MKILVDMNLSPSWIPLLRSCGHEALHWSAIGDPSAPDVELLAWARDRMHVVFTHDLDFGILLAATDALGPSIVQVRTLDVSPQTIGDAVLRVLEQHQTELEAGAIVSLDHARSRVRLLPLRKRES